jgi:hypothetical protein
MPWNSLLSFFEFYQKNEQPFYFLTDCYHPLVERQQESVVQCHVPASEWLRPGPIAVRRERDLRDNRKHCGGDGGQRCK